MRIKFTESTFVRGEAVDVGDVRDEDAPLARALIASRRAVAAVDTAPPEPVIDATPPEIAAAIGNETATVATKSAPRRRG